MKNPTLFRQLQEELSAIKPDEFYLIRSPMKEGEKVLGEASEDMKRIYTLLMRYASELRQSAVEHMLDPDCSEAEDKELHGRLRRLNTAGKLLSELFWAEANERFGSWSDENGLGIRDGWQIVTLSPDRVQNQGVLAGMLELMVVSGFRPSGPHGSAETNAHPRPPPNGAGSKGRRK